MSDNRRLTEMKKEYENIEIPAQLSQIVRDTIAKVEKENEEAVLQGEREFRKTEIDKTKIDKIKRSSKMKKRIIGAVAAFAVVFGGFGVGVNTSEAFASTVADIPVLNSLAKIFTVEKVHEENDVYVADLNIPGVEGLNNPELEKKINNLVKTQVDAAVEETKQMVAEDKKAWLETGGKEEDYINREISVDYEVKCLNEDFISFVVYKTQTMASAYFDMFYYNYDLKTGEELSLEDMLGSDYKAVANEQIKAEIAKRAQDPDAIYFDGSDGIDGFESISDNQVFYVNEKGNPVIVFNKYEIAPGYMGIQEFEIVK